VIVVETSCFFVSKERPRADERNHHRHHGDIDGVNGLLFHTVRACRSADGQDGAHQEDNDVFLGFSPTFSEEFS
jgi:hypothetical protein